MSSNFNDYKDYIVGNEIINFDSIKFIIYSNHSPSIEEMINYNNHIYIVDYVDDVTTDKEFDEGLSYVEVTMSKQE